MRGVWRWYRSLRRWLQWTIGIGLVLLVVVAIPSSGQQPAQERAARSRAVADPQHRYVDTSLDADTDTDADGDAEDRGASSQARERRPPWPRWTRCR